MPEKKSSQNGNGKALTNPNPGGRPKTEVNEDVVIALASIGCTGEEIATYLGCSRTTIFARFSDCLEKGHTDQRVSLRRKQFELAMQGDKTMLVWLGKQYLGQADRREVEHSEAGTRIGGVSREAFMADVVDRLLAEDDQGEG